ncbi:MAG: DUF433 domain-containing protein [Candidatus Nanohalobium sp.]
MERVEVDPEKMTGKPVIKGTRIPVEKIVKLLAHGLEVEEILEEYPNLEEEDVRAALEYAAETLEEVSVYPAEGGDLEVHS